MTKRRVELSPANKDIRTPFVDGETPGVNGNGHTAYTEATTDTKNTSGGGFVKIGGDDLGEASDPRRMRALLGNGLRMRNLEWIDAQRWHYSLMFLLFLDFAIEFLALSFASNRQLSSVFDELSLYLSSVAAVIYTIDMAIRISGLRAALLKSNSTVADLGALICILGILSVRHFYPLETFSLAIAHIIFVALRLMLKPRARMFSKKLHKFGSGSSSSSRRRTSKVIRIAMDSVRAALYRIPGLSAVAIEMMETDLLIICGRDQGDMSCDELMQFLERALVYRPRELTATDFLSYLQDIDATSVRYAYGASDVVRSTLWHWRSQSWDLFWSIVVVCVNALVIPVQSYVVGYVSDTALGTDGDVGDDAQDALELGVLAILLLCVPFVLANYGIGYFQAKVISRATERMQLGLIDTILKQNTEFFALRSEGDLNNLFASDIARVSALWQSVFWNLLNPFVSVLFGFGFILIQDWPTGVLAFAFTSVLLSSGPQGIASQRSKDFGSKNAFVTAEFQNGIACQKLIRSYAIRIPFLKKFGHSLQKLRESSFAKDIWSSIVQIYVESAMYFFVAIEVAALLIKTFNGEITTGTFFAFVTMLSRISAPVTTLGGFMRVAIGNSSSLQRLDDILIKLGSRDNNNNGDDGTNGNDGDSSDSRSNLPALPRLQKSLDFKGIFFRYDSHADDYILNDLSASIQKGTYTCICGPSGCGKSTLLNVLMQFYEPLCGGLYVDGNAITNYSKASFMAQTAVVFQDISILNGTILDNIRYGNVSATDQECMEAASLAECNFISNLKAGFHTVIGQHATTSLSGGQAQRICLARAICRKPSLLLLDEATSALDPETESSIINALERLAKKTEMTIISVTHRLQTAVNANLILVMNNGTVAESGTFLELKANKESLFSEMLQQSNREVTPDTILLPATISASAMKSSSSVTPKTPETLVSRFKRSQANARQSIPSAFEEYSAVDTSSSDEADRPIVLKEFQEHLAARAQESEEGGKVLTRSFIDIFVPRASRASGTSQGSNTDGLRRRTGNASLNMSSLVAEPDVSSAGFHNTTTSTSLGPHATPATAQDVRNTASSSSDWIQRYTGDSKEGHELHLSMTDGGGGGSPEIRRGSGNEDQDSYLVL